MNGYRSLRELQTINLVLVDGQELVICIVSCKYHLPVQIVVPLMG